MLNRRDGSRLERLNPLMRRILGVILICLVISGCSRSDDSWPRIVESGVLRIGLDPTFPPFESTGDDGLSGFDVDLAEALAAELGLQAEFVHFGYDGLYDALGTMQVDVLASALVIVPGRMRDFAYSEPYFNAGEVLIVSADEEAFFEMQDLDGSLLAVELGALGHVEAIEWAKRLSDLTILTFESAGAALEAVQAGQADAALVDAVSGRSFIAGQTSDSGALRRLSEPVTVEPFALVVRSDDQELLRNLNAGLEVLKESGRLDEIVHRWVGP